LVCTAAGKDAGMAGEQIVIFESKFETDAKSGILADVYPFIRADKPEDVSVNDGVLVKYAARGENEVIELCEGLSVRTDVAYHISITCADERYDRVLGCYVGEGNARNRFAFHPKARWYAMSSASERAMGGSGGMRGGQFRIEGPGGCWNVNIGFTPPASYIRRERPVWPEPERKKERAREADAVGCRFVVVLNRDGTHEVTIAHPKGPEHGSYTKKWSNPELWTEDMVKSPPFGVYDGDIRIRGRVFYHDFTVSSATARVRVLTLGSQQLENSLMMLTFTGLAGDVVQTMEVDPTSSVEDLYASLAKVLPGPIKLIRPDASVLDRTAGKSTLEAALGWAPQRGGGSSAEAPRSGGGDTAAAGWRRLIHSWWPCCPLA